MVKVPFLVPFLVPFTILVAAAVLKLSPVAGFALVPTPRGGHDQHASSSASHYRTAFRSLSPYPLFAEPSSITMTLADDPFEAFGDDDDDVDVDGSTAAVQETNPNQRDKSCGALVFREGTEQALLHYVRNQLDHPSSRSCSRISSGSDSETISAREQVLQAVDDFCYSRHWMMHIGPLKGVVLQDFLTRRVETYIQAADFTYPLVIVEIGTYCGYSAVRMCQTVLAKLASAGDDDDHSLAKASFYVFTVDVDPGNVAVARQLVALAGVESYVEFLVLDTDGNAPPDQLSVKLQAAMTERFPNRQEATADFVFIDHAKELYLDDLLQLETSSIIRAGTAVAADNILFFRLDDYRQHMQALAEASIVETRLCEGHLEYLDDQDHLENNGMDLRDGLELTCYLQDPPVVA